MKISIGDLILVVWRDAEVQDGWSTQEECLQRPHTLFQQYGLFNKIDDNYIYLSFAGGLGKNETRSKEVIPIGCVVGRPQVILTRGEIKNKLKEVFNAASEAEKE